MKINSFLICILVLQSCVHFDSNIQTDKVTVIPINDEGISVDSNFESDSIGYKVLFISGWRKYYIEIQYENESIFSDSINSRPHFHDVILEKNFNIAKLKKDKLELTFLIFPKDTKYCYEWNASLSIFYKSCLIKPSRVNLHYQSELEGTEGLGIDGKEYYVYLSYIEKR